MRGMFGMLSVWDMEVRGLLYYWPNIDLECLYFVSAIVLTLAQGYHLCEKVLKC